MYHMRSFILPVVLLLTITASSQKARFEEGFIVTRSGDTLRGLVYWKKNALAGDSLLQLAHAALLEPAQVSAWARHLQDYKLTPLFAQLGHPAPPPALRAGPHIDDRLGWLSDNFALRGAFGKRGYVREAMEAGFAFRKSSHSPLPGDMGVMLYRNNSGNLTGSGHIFAVTRVSANGQTINTIGGNEGNRLKHGIRDVSQPTIEGWIGLYGDNRSQIEIDHEKGTIERPGAATTTGGTR